MTPPTISQLMYAVAIFAALISLALIIWAPGLWAWLGGYLMFCAGMTAVIARELK